MVCLAGLTQSHIGIILSNRFVLSVDAYGAISRILDTPGHPLDPEKMLAHRLSSLGRSCGSQLLQQKFGQNTLAVPSAASCSLVFTNPAGL